MYERAIVDELGYVVAWLVGMSWADINSHLQEHPEHSIERIKVG